MDLFASIFGFILVALSVAVTYHYGIKPDREEKKRRAEQQATGRNPPPAWSGKGREKRPAPN